MAETLRRNAPQAERLTPTTDSTDRWPPTTFSRMPASSPLLQEICCLLGQGVAGNATQFMMEKAFAHHGLDWRYLTLEVAPAALGDAVRGMRAMGFRGGNVTMPHKVAVIEFLDQLSDAAAKIGAVNCIIRDGQ